MPNWGATFAWTISGKNIIVSKEKQNQIDSVVNDGVEKAKLYKQLKSPNKIYSQEEKKELLTKVHLMGHFSTKYMVNHLRQQGHSWPRMYRDCELFTTSCIQCNRFNTGKTKYHPTKPLEATLPRDHIAIDLHQMSFSSNGYTFILVVIDVCTRFVWIRPIKDKRAATVAKELLSIFRDFSFCRVCQSDNGKEFVAEVFKEFCRICCIDKRLIASYNPYFLLRKAAPWYRRASLLGLQAAPGK